jgi:hypothetical protein
MTIIMHHLLISSIFTHHNFNVNYHLHKLIKVISHWIMFFTLTLTVEVALIITNSPQWTKG